MGTSPKTGDLELGRKIAARREELGMSRKELAEITNLSYPYIAQIETGYRLPSAKHQIPLAKALGMSLDELFGAEEELSTRPVGSTTTRRGRRRTMDEAIDDAVGAIESLPDSVRLEALSRIQLRIMTGVTQEQAKRHSRS